MPFKSEKQRSWMFANKPEMAKEWAHKYGSKIHPKKHAIGEAMMNQTMKKKNDRKKT